MRYPFEENFGRGYWGIALSAERVGDLALLHRVGIRKFFTRKENLVLVLFKPALEGASSHRVWVKTPADLEHLLSITDPFQAMAYVRKLEQDYKEIKELNKLLEN